LGAGRGVEPRLQAYETRQATRPSHPLLLCWKVGVVKFVESSKDALALAAGKLADGGGKGPREAGLVTARGKGKPNAAGAVSGFRHGASSP